MSGMSTVPSRHMCSEASVPGRRMSGSHVSCDRTYDEFDSWTSNLRNPSRPFALGSRGEATSRSVEVLVASSSRSTNKTLSRSYSYARNVATREIRIMESNMDCRKALVIAQKVGTHALVQ